ncbi:phosphopantothenoylcysteine decarboxylase-like [Homalodisca vitripennis]|uniref:phosphopantothenoylcysteine decarboxylase-like n=1 Tax=Homalodisca vitripennis TaxID=197043 RepID=UPI001EEBE3F6|nr:phosphopantothenoylcysteine decarboxylase-like [Homalodisca vitripennis]
MEKKKVLVGCCGSVATIKLPVLINSFLDRNCEVEVVMTQHALHFVSLAEISPLVKVHVDEDEWTSWKQRGDPVLHIELGRWADVFVIAPLDANTLAKMANGLCDNLLTCVVRAWDVRKPLFFCPAMNTRMWEHPITSGHVNLLKSWGYQEIPCISKTLMCGDTGTGAMAEVDTIVQTIL